VCVCVCVCVYLTCFLVVQCSPTTRHTAVWPRRTGHWSVTGQCGGARDHPQQRTWPLCWLLVTRHSHVWTTHRQV